MAVVEVVWCPGERRRMGGRGLAGDVDGVKRFLPLTSNDEGFRWDPAAAQPAAAPGRAAGATGHAPSATGTSVLEGSFDSLRGTALRWSAASARAGAQQ